MVAATGPVLAANSDERERIARIECLIELLASKNAAPTVVGDATMGDDQTIDFPKSYERSLQVPVYLAVKELLAEDEAAMDLLLAHKNDDRYSFSVNSSTDYNISVSGACRWIAKQKLSCYEPEIHVITRSQFGVYPEVSPFKGPGESFESWWNKNKGRGLAALQLEAIDAEIKFMQEVDGKTALPWHAAAEPLPIGEFNRLRDDNLRILKALRRYVSETQTPYRPNTLDSEYHHCFGLPWTRRRHNL
jgi:hypothetical protein